ncbi:hypothetical protein OSB04_031034 [Centaurea solstitialis]|uniref:Uncharacterized protein n=1 Tax=Centaurea solstitialis TaxID=347529 RepID=A0AA38SLE2_9ASTR|nr:hypothetical protein OSB04_031033 [Centaurea solstitialis]KAJ9538301.1 hypothetical protein OSB04_031034 [Centaurea solstitialis]
MPQNYVRPTTTQSPPTFTYNTPGLNHIPTMTSSTVHTTIQPDNRTTNRFLNPVTSNDPTNVRLKMLEEHNEKMLALLAKLPGAAVLVEIEPKTWFQASPYVDEIALMDIPKKYNIPTFTTKYSGITDLVEHVAQYKQLMWTVSIPSQYQEACMCKSFGSTLTGAADNSKIIHILVVLVYTVLPRAFERKSMKRIGKVRKMINCGTKDS